MLTPSRATLEAARAIPRTTPIGRTAATVALGGIPLLFAAARGTRDLSVTVTIMAVIGGAATAWFVDEAPGEVLTPLPIGPTVRRALRAAYLIIVVAATMTALATIAARLSDAEVAILPHIPLVVATACVSVALAIAAYRNGEHSPGAWGVPGGVVTVVFLGGLAMRFPRWLPHLVPRPSFARWWLVAAVALAAILVTGRDPGAP